MYVCIYIYIYRYTCILFKYYGRLKWISFPINAAMTVRKNASDEKHFLTIILLERLMHMNLDMTDATF